MIDVLFENLHVRKLLHLAIFGILDTDGTYYPPIFFLFPPFLTGPYHLFRAITGVGIDGCRERHWIGR